MKHYLVVNPRSANGQTGRRWPELSARIRQRIGEFEHRFTEGPMEAIRLARDAILRGFDCIAAVGGDGTINEVANGFFRDGTGTAINPDAALAVIPRGTGGDFCRTFGWDAQLDSAVERLSAPSVVPLDVGLVEFDDTKGGRGSRYFVNVCSFGVSGLVDQEVNKRSKALGGKVSFFLGSARAMLKYRDCRVRFSLDGGPAEEMPVTAFSIANGQYFGGGMKVAPSADPSDGVFEVTIWSGFNIVDFALKSKGLYDGTHVKFDGTRTMRCREVEAEGIDGEEVLVDIDGESSGRLPVRVRVLPQAIRLKT